MPSTAFDTRTSFRNDWELVDGVEDGVLVPTDADTGKDLDRHVDIKLVEGPVTHPPFAAAAAGMRTRTAQLIVWLTNYDADEPRHGYIIRRGTVDWAVYGAPVAHPTGQFVCLCSLIGEREAPNAL